MLSASVAQINTGFHFTNIHNFLKHLHMLHKAEKIAGWHTVGKDNTACLQIWKREMMSVNDYISNA